MELYSEDYTKASHILLKEGTPIPFFKNEKTKVLYETIDPSIHLVSIRKGFKVYHYYVKEERVNALLKSTYSL